VVPSQANPRFRTAPTAARALRILELLAETPTQGYTQAELQRRLGYSHGNLHAMLATMEATGHVRRDAVDRTYTLGPALLAIGESARLVYPWVEAAHPFMNGLAEQLGTECHAATRTGDTILIVTRVGPLQPLGYGVSTGQRIPFVPPIGSSFISWSSEQEIDAYLHSGSARLSRAELDRYHQALALVRRQGYSVHYEADPRRSLGERTERVVRNASLEDDRGALDAAGQLAHTDYLSPGVGSDPGAILNMSSPVFGADGLIQFTVGVSFTSPSMAERSVLEVGGLLSETVREITKAVGGRPPPPPD
jgi:DNA-binding IclR family transcriptional regulator